VIEEHLRASYQRVCIDPLLKFRAIKRLKPERITLLACGFGVALLPLLALGSPLLSFCFLLLSGFLDTLDGSVARLSSRATARGAALDIVSDRLVESAVIIGLFAINPSLRALPCLAMFTAVLICVTSFLIVGIFSENHSEKSFHYSPGLMERAEAFLFFGAMILFPSAFVPLAYLFSGLVLLTAAVRMVEFLRRFKL
jgi:archaetidylinositol phosphate synthase